MLIIPLAAAVALGLARLSAKKKRPGHPQAIMNMIGVATIMVSACIVARSAYPNAPNPSIPITTGSNGQPQRSAP